LRLYCGSNPVRSRKISLAYLSASLYGALTSRVIFLIRYSFDCPGCERDVWPPSLRLESKDNEQKWQWKVLVWFKILLLQSCFKMGCLIILGRDLISCEDFALILKLLLYFDLTLRDIVGPILLMPFILMSKETKTWGSKEHFTSGVEQAVFKI
jgi:hypothetical protein